MRIRHVKMCLLAALLLAASLHAKVGNATTVFLDTPGAVFSATINGGTVFIPGTTLHVTTWISGTIVVGALVRGAGVADGTTIVPGGTGTGTTGDYNVSISQLINPVEAMSADAEWTVPADWDSAANTVECVGAGGASGQSVTGAGGGAYTLAANVALTPGATVGVRIPQGPLGGTSSGGGANGDGAYVCSAVMGCASLADSAVLIGAAGGKGLSPFAGGAASGGIGDVKFSGGAGGVGRGLFDGGGGGGAAGPNGDGGAGSPTSSAGGAGGGADGGTAGSGTTAGVGANGGGNGGTPNGQAGGNGTEWDSTHGSGGGGAGAASGIGGGGGRYGGGGGAARSGSTGGNGGSGFCVANYTPAVGGGGPTRGPIVEIIRWLAEPPGIYR